MDDKQAVTDEETPRPRDDARKHAVRALAGLDQGQELGRARGEQGRVVNQQMAIVIAGLLIAAAVAFTNRWELFIIRDPPIVLRLDRWTGAVASCKGQGDISRDFRCGGPGP